MVRHRQPGLWSADLVLWAWVAPGQLFHSSGPEWHRAGGSALVLWVGQLASSPGAHPLNVSGVGTPPWFQVWAPSALRWVCETGLQVIAGAAYPAFTVQGLRGEGRQRLRLLLRVL